MFYQCSGSRGTARSTVGSLCGSAVFCSLELAQTSLWLNKIQFSPTLTPTQNCKNSFLTRNFRRLQKCQKIEPCVKMSEYFHDENAPKFLRFCDPIYDVFTNNALGWPHIDHGSSDVPFQTLAEITDVTLVIKSKFLLFLFFQFEIY